MCPYLSDTAASSTANVWAASARAAVLCSAHPPTASEQAGVEAREGGREDGRANIYPASTAVFPALIGILIAVWIKERVLLIIGPLTSRRDDARRTNLLLLLLLLLVVVVSGCSDFSRASCGYHTFLKELLRQTATRSGTTTGSSRETSSPASRLPLVQKQGTRN